MACEADLVPVNEREVETRRVGDDDGLCGSPLSHAAYSRITSSEGCGFSRQAAHASGCDFHHSIGAASDLRINLCRAD